jgi:cytochrome bd ubiquinol oxidase subunit I
MELDPVFLSRVQFAFVIAFHILFPAFTIGLASYIAVLEGLWFTTKRDIYFHIARFWTRIFAVSFGMGVVSGIVMSFQFGTNWSRFSDATANVLGPLLSYEVLTAFFLEATFLGILLFGRNLVSPRVHFLSAVMVALGTLVSSFWILAANSWMHTPAGYEIRDGIFHVTSWVEAIFNPSFPYRLSHMVTAAFLTTAFVVIGISAWYVLKGRFTDSARRMFSMTLWLVTVLAPLQIVLGDLHGLNTFEHQPVKVAAMEGHWETQTGAPMILFAVPDSEAETNHFEIAIPYLGSLILVHDVAGEVRGLKAWPADQRPPVAIVFYAFRIMVTIGFLMLGIVLASLWLRRRKRLFETRWFLRLCMVCAPIGFVALIAGWFVTEVGRQPWVVYGVMRTADATSPAITGGGVLASLLGYITVYAIIFTAGVYYILRLVQRGPEEAQTAPQGRAARPLSGAQQPFEAGE